MLRNEENFDASVESTVPTCVVMSLTTSAGGDVEIVMPGPVGVARRWSRR